MELSKLRLKLDSVKNEVISAPPCNDAIHNEQRKLVFCDLLLGDIAYLPAFGFLTAVPFPFSQIHSIINMAHAHAISA